MKNDNNILGCFVSYPSVMYDATEEQKANATLQGDLFRTYIWGEKGICDSIKSLNKEKYGKDLELVLFQFYINPLAYEVAILKEIESYRKNEKSIGIPIIVTNDNFFDKNELARYNFLKESILRKIDLLAEVVTKRKLDTNIDLLKSDLENLLY